MNFLATILLNNDDPCNSWISIQSYQCFRHKEIYAIFYFQHSKK